MARGEPDAAMSGTSDAEPHLAIVFTDIEGSTSLLRRLGVDGFADLLGWHLRVIEEEVRRCRGSVEHVEGDGALLLFPAAALAIAATVAMQRRFAADDRVRVRMAVHVGEARHAAGQLVGIGIHQAARVAAAAHGGQVILSDAARSASGPLPGGVRVVPVGAYRMRDHDDEVALYRLDIDGVPTVDTPLRAVPASAHLVPEPGSPLIGRDRELARVRASLPGARLVTVCGPPGIGATRFAAEVAIGAAEHAPDGTWWVDLSAARDVAEIHRRVGLALGLVSAPEDDPVDALQTALIGRRLLLVLDGVGRALEAAREVVAAVLGVTGPLVLVTARSPLGLAAETVVRLQPLTPPAPTDSADAAMGNDAVVLLADLARRSDPTFVLDRENARLVAHLCHLTEGVPLAIELAASRLATTDLADVVAELRAAGGLATGDTGDVVTWALTRLGPDAQLLHRRLGLTRWSVDREQAAALSGIAAHHVDRAARELVAAGLLEELRGSPTRWRQLRPVHEHAATMLEEAGEVADAELALARWSAERLGSDSPVPIADLDAHRAAFEPAARSDAELAARLTTGAWAILRRHGLGGEAGRRVRRVLELLTAAGTEPSARLRILEARVHLDQDDPAAAANAARRVLDGDRDATPTERAEALLILAEVEEGPAVAASLAAEAAAEARAGTDPRVEALAWSAVVLTSLVIDDVAAARQALRRAADAADASGRSEAEHAVARADVALADHVGDTQRAIRAAEALLDRVIRDEAWEEVDGAAWRLTDLATSDGDLEAGARGVEQLVANAERRPTPERLVLAHGYAEGVAIDAGRLDVARRHTERLHALLPLLGELPVHRRVIRFGDLLLATAADDLPALRSATDRIEPTPDELDDPQFLLNHGFVLAQAWSRLERHEQVVDIARRGIPVAAGAHAPLIESIYRLVAGVALLHLGDRTLAAEHLMQCLRLGIEGTAGAVVASGLEAAAQLVGAAPVGAATAATLLGAAQAERERTGASELKGEEIDALRASLTALLSADAFAEHQRAGRDLGRDDAVGLAVAALHQVED